MVLNSTISPQYDLTQKLSPYLDRHLTFPIFSFLETKKVYTERSIKMCFIKVLDKTYMLDFMIELLESEIIGEKAPEELLKRRQRVLDIAVESRDKVIGLLQILEDPTSYDKIKNFTTLEELYKEFNLKPGVLEDLFKHAHVVYEAGNYQMSSELLKWYRKLEKIGDIDGKMSIRAMWGGFGSFILQKEWGPAADSAVKLDEYINSEQLYTGALKNDVLLHRTWFAHWILFILFKVEWTGANVKKSEEQQSLVYNWNKLVDVFLNEKNVSVICFSAPHLLRYVAALLILHNKRLKHLLTDVAKIMHQEQECYQDPLTKFLIALYIDMDFDDAQVQLKECQSALEIDYFLSEHWEAFQDNARLLIFESYCRVHQYIDIDMMAQKLNMNPEAAELWIVKLIQSARLNARIDSENNRVLMGKKNPTVYQQVIEKAKNMAFRTTLIQANIANAQKANERKHEHANKHY